MLLSQKIMQLRKKNGWSQEELANQLEVSRQSVSKWEAGGSIPDLNKILKMSELFGVSTDYLLKEEIEDDAFEKIAATEAYEYREERSVSAEMANEYMALCKSEGKKIAIGTVLCIVSPTILILLAALSATVNVLSENLAAGLGLLALLGCVGVAVYLFISAGNELKKYKFMTEESIDLAYGVQGIIKERRKEFESIYQFNLTLGIMLCILSVAPIFIGLAMNVTELYMCIAIDILLVMVAIGVQRIISVSMIWGSFDKLLMEGDYSKHNRENNKFLDAVGAIYWPTIVAIYLGISLYTEKWKISWIIWVVAGVFYPALTKFICLLREDRSRRRRG